MKEIIEETNGRRSSIRIVLIVSAIIMLYLLYLFTVMVRHELAQESINYTGLTAIFSAMFVQFILVVIMKVIQKKYEK